jgi:hypothetical protein
MRLFEGCWASLETAFTILTMLEEVIARVTGLQGHSISPGKIDGIQFLHLDWNGPDDQWNVSICYEKFQWNVSICYEKGVPVSASWYIWWVDQKNQDKHFKEILGDRYELGDVYGGNGHEYAEIKPVSEEAPKP